MFQLANCPNFKTFEMLWWRALILTTFVRSLRTTASVRWPAETYGIPKPASGCPLSDGFQWEEGWRLQDSEDIFSDNAKSAEFHLDGEVGGRAINRSFCIKTSTVDDDNRTDWPRGNYCIYMYQRAQCPEGLAAGSVFWDDENVANANDKGGTLPDGEYNKNTLIRFCCATGGDKNEPMSLPSKSPFFLLAYASEKCQMVKWAVTSVEWIHYNTEHWLNSDKGTGAYPYNAGEVHPNIYYCYYHGCNETLTTVNGTFQSPNYPGKYPDGQHCSWRVTVNVTQRIHLIFSSFNLQNESNTDALYVYDGENATREMLGVFYGGHPPPAEGLYSSSNRMFLIFKSDKTDSYTGFSASYYSVKKSAPSETTTKTPDMTISSPLTHATLRTLEKTTSARELRSTREGPSRKSGSKDERKQPPRKGFNVVAVIVPIVLVTFLVAGFIAIFFYCRRKRTKKDAKPNKIIFSARSKEESPISAENPHYDRDLAIANANVNDPSFQEENLLYTEVHEPEKEWDGPCMDQTDENPLYEPATADDAGLNPIYDGDLVIANTNKPSFSEGNELYNEVQDTEDQNKEKQKHFIDQRTDNPLYGDADVGDAVFNPIYDSFT